MTLLTNFKKTKQNKILRKPVILLIDSSRESGCEVWTCDDDFRWFRLLCLYIGSVHSHKPHVKSCFEGQTSVQLIMCRIAASYCCDYE